MIQPSELRVGNLLKYNIGENTPDWVVCKIDVQDIEWCERRKEDFNNCHRKIELTHQWLKDLGLTGRADFMYKGIVGVQIRDGNFYLSLEDLGGSIFHSVVEVKYVHHLQNLYLDLTGQTLIFNKP